MNYCARAQPEIGTRQVVSGDIAIQKYTLLFISIGLFIYTIRLFLYFLNDL